MTPGKLIGQLKKDEIPMGFYRIKNGILMQFNF